MPAVSLLERLLIRLVLEARAVARAPFAFALLAIAVIFFAVVAFNSQRESNALRGELAEYKQKLSGASPDQAKAALEALEKEVTALEARLKPRRLAPHQRQVIAELGKPPPGAQYTLSLVQEGGCWDCPQYVADFTDTFRGISGWRITNRVTMGLAQRPPRGLAIVVADPAHLSPQEATLLRALQGAAIAIDIAPAQSGIDNIPELLFAALAPQ